MYAGGRVLLRSRRGTDMTASFPEIRAAALAQLPENTGLDGELVVWERDRLAFERPQQRLARRGAPAAQAAREWPAHFVAFDLVHRGDDLTGWPYARRRAALEALSAERGLTAPWVLCPSATDPALAREWLSWTAAGVEGLCFKRLEESYRGGVRSWRKYKVRVTTEAVIGAVTGSLAAPRTLLWAVTAGLAACGTSAAAPPCPGPPATLWPTSGPRRAAGIRGRAGRSRQAGERSAPSMPSWCSQMS